MKRAISFLALLTLAEENRMSKRSGTFAFIVAVLLIAPHARAQSECAWDTTTTPGTIVQTCGKVGIGTTAPSNALHLLMSDGIVNLPLKVETSGPDSITGLSLKNDAQNWHIRVDGTDGDKLKFYDATSSAVRMAIDTLGQVGIGTASPLGRFSVMTATHLPGSGAWGTAQLVSSDALAADKGGVLNLGGIYTSSGAMADWAGIAGLKNNAVDGDDGGYLALYTRTNGLSTAERMRIDSTGNVGIGALAPSQKLDVNGNVALTGSNRALTLGNGQGIRDPGGPDLDLVVSPNFSGNIKFLTGLTSSAERMRIDSTGKVGIGTTVPGQKLSVAGTIESTTGGFKFPDGTSQTSAFAPSAGVLSVNSVASPKYLLQSTTSTQQSAFSTSGAGAFIDIAGHATASNNVIVFRTTNTANSSAPIEAMRITSTGAVEIGSPTPDATMRLNVSGNANITGTLTANAVVNAVFGQDVAEWVRADRDLAAGTVVILNPEKSNEVMPSTSAYDTTVAGVVSAQPGVILGRPGALKATVATSGRVRVRVDARKGAIRVGDLLVTSDEPGTAMKSQPIDVGGRKFHQPGTILGKALEPLSDGVGEILVLLCLG
jgi:hypothetical protein